MFRPVPVVPFVLRGDYRGGLQIHGLTIFNFSFASFLLSAFFYPAKKQKKKPPLAERLLFY